MLRVNKVINIFSLVIMGFVVKGADAADIAVAKVVDSNAIDHVGYSEQPFDLSNSVSHLVYNLGCRRGKVPNDTWDSDRFLWRVAQELQAGAFTLDELIKALEPLIEKKLTPESSPRESSWFAQNPGQRAELVAAIREFLEPFANEGRSDTRTVKLPKIYQQQYSGLLGELPGYRERISRINRIKDVFHQVGERRGLNGISSGRVTYNYLPCNEEPDDTKDLSLEYRRSATTHELNDRHSPALDVLADRVLNEMACRPALPAFPMWYVAERMLRGDFSREAWTAAWEAKIGANAKLSSAARKRLIEYNQSMMQAFAVVPPQGFALKDVPDATVSALAKNYKTIREGEFPLNTWLQDKDNGFSQPCNDKYQMKRPALQLAVSDIVEHPEKASQASVCDSGVRSLKKAYDKKLEKLKDEMRITFFQSKLSQGRGSDFNQVLDQMIASNDFVESSTQKLTQASSQMAHEVTKKAIDEKWTSIKHIVNLGDDRVTKAVFADHADDMRQFWTEKFLLGDMDPASPEGKKLIDAHNARLRRKNSMRLLVSCLEADGRAIAMSTHGALDYSDSVPKGEVGVENREIESLKAIIDKRKARQREAVQEAARTKESVTAHHYDHQTNVGSGSVSIDQSSVGLTAGSFYHSEISRILKHTDSLGRPVTYLGDAEAKKSIRENCRLDQVFSYMKPKEIDEVNELLFRSMSASQNGYKYSWVSWTERLSLDEQFEALDNYVYIQNFCLPLHLDFAAKVVEHNPGAVGTLKNQSRKDICANVGVLPNPDNAALEALTNAVQSNLMASYAGAKSQGGALANLKAHDQNVARLSVQRDQLMREMSAYEESKLDKGAQKYFADLEHAGIDKPGHLFAFFKTYNRPDSEAARKSSVEEMGGRQRESFIKFLQADPSSKDFAKTRESYLENRQDYARSGESWVGVWVNRSEEEYQARLGTRVSSGFYSGFNHFKDRFGAMAHLYIQYEEELAILLRACKADEATIRAHTPNFAASFEK